MVWLDQRERDLIRRIGPVVLRRYDDLVGDWASRWRDAVQTTDPPPDLPRITRVAVENGVDAAIVLQQELASSLVAVRMPLERVVTAVLLWEEAVIRRLARDAEQDIFSSASALNRLLHGLVLAVAEEYQANVLRERDAVRRGLEEADRLKMEVISMISHDLQTPITTIQGAAHSMLDPEGLEPAQLRRFAELVINNAGRLARLIAQILDLSRIEARAMDLELDRVDVAPVVRRLLESVLPAALVRVDIAPDLPAALADRDAFERIVLNLVDNAIRYSPPGMPVTVSAIPRGDQIEIRVEDGGPGIAEERRPGLFSKFYQVDSSLSGRRGGSGLGLAIVKGLAESMGGSVGHRPRAPAGSVFWVRIPVFQRTGAAL